MSATAALDRQLLARADLLLLLASWLRLAPAAETRPASPAELEELAAACGLGSELAPELTGLAAARRASSSADWSAECTGLFEGGCPCAVNETAYVRRDKGAILADLAGFYRAFGFAPAADVGEKPDHIVSELQFTALLLVMLARARDADDRRRPPRRLDRALLREAGRNQRTAGPRPAGHGPGSRLAGARRRARLRRHRSDGRRHAG
ncbi:MAG: molecular chaperone TorD family protein [Thermoanaerobaculales bacterium]|nr:molecular chaperone TorD family protein [Thermoanaerobaculales bacterium]